MVEVDLVNSSRFFPAYALVVRDPDGRVVLGEPLLASQATAAGILWRRSSPIEGGTVSGRGGSM